MPNYRIVDDQCGAGGCTKKAAKGKSFCGGKVCTRTSTRRFKRGVHTKVADAKRDLKDQKMRAPKFQKPEEDERVFDDPFPVDDSSDDWGWGQWSNGRERDEFSGWGSQL